MQKKHPGLRGEARDQLRREVVRLYRAHLPLWKVAEQVGCSTASVWRLLVEAGEPRRPKTRQARPGPGGGS